MKNIKKLVKTRVYPYGTGVYGPEASELSKDIEKFAKRILKKYHGRLHPHEISHIVFREFNWQSTFQCLLDKC